MKRPIVISIAAVLTLAGLSCTKDPAFNDISELKAEQEVTIKATIASSDPDTKTVRQSNGAVFWAPKDSISLFYGSGDNGGNKFTAVCTEPSAVSNFTGTIGVITGGGEITMDQIYFWGVYPYSSTTACSGGSIYYDLPSRQVSAAGSFSNGQFPTMGRSHELQISFYNICGGIKFTVVNEGIRSVEFRNLNGESIAGKLNVGFDQNGLPQLKGISDGSDTIVVTPEDGNAFVPGVDYYVVIPPVTMSSGLEVTYKTLTEKATKTILSSIPITRSMFSILNGKDEGLTFELRDDAYVPFEDANFKAYCVQKFDTDSDGEISFKEATAVEIINVSTDNIESLEGIEYFINVNAIACNGSSSLKLGKLTSLDLSNNTKLEYLECNNNILTSLNVCNCPSLEFLSCYYNQLSILDINNNTALEYLFCDDNQLTTLDVSNNVALKQFSCYNNSIRTLDITNNTLLTFLDCSSNKISSLDVSNNEVLSTLHCSHMVGDQGTNTLINIYITTGQSINYITDNRSNNYVPAETVIISKKQIEAVDLGLSVKWASYNVGACSPEDYGDYYAWGDVETYYESGSAHTRTPIWKEGKSKGYVWASYKWCNGARNTLTKYVCGDPSWGWGDVDGKSTLELNDDIANMKFGNGWRMPTDNEWAELIEDCNWTYTTENGVNGMQVTSKTNGNSVFIPASGALLSVLGDLGSYGYYWSSSLNMIYMGPSSASCLKFGPDGLNSNSNADDRCSGFAIRPVFSD